MSEKAVVERVVPEGYSERLYNEDLRPLREDERGWTTYSLFCTWMADVHSIGGYTFAAGLFFLGLTGWQVFLALIARGCNTTRRTQSWDSRLWDGSAFWSCGWSSCSC